MDAIRNFIDEMAAIWRTKALYADVGEVGIFERHDEIFNLAFGILLTILVFAAWMFLPSLTKLEASPIYFLKRVLFLNGTHTVFTWIMILSLPELREWSGKVIREERVNFWLRGLWVAIAIAVIMFFGIEGRGLFPSDWGIAAWAVVAIPVGLHHSLSQSRGLSYCYNSNYLASLGHPGDLRRCVNLSQRIEKFGVGLLVVCYSSVFITRAFHFPHFSLVIEELLAAVAVAIVFLSSVVLPKKLWMRKLLFHPRILPTILVGSSIPAVAAFQSVHGVEYLIVFRKMTKKSLASEKTKRSVYIAAAVGSGIMVLLMYPRILPHFFNFAFAEIAFGIFFVVHQAHSFFHYYLDAVLFSMKMPATRQHVLPLIGMQNESVATVNLVNPRHTA